MSHVPGRKIRHVHAHHAALRVSATALLTLARSADHAKPRVQPADRRRRVLRAQCRRDAQPVPAHRSRAAAGPGQTHPRDRWQLSPHSACAPSPVSQSSFPHTRIRTRERIVRHPSWQFQFVNSSAPTNKLTLPLKAPNPNTCAMSRDSSHPLAPTPATPPTGPCCPR